MKIKEIRKFLFGTLRGRLILYVALLNALVMNFFVLYLTMRQRSLLINHQQETAITFAQTLSTSASVWLAAYDVSGLQELVDAQRQYPGLDYAILTDNEGHILAHTDQSKIGQYLLDLPREARMSILNKTPELVDIVVPAILGGRQVGWVRIGLDNKIVIQKLEETTHKGVLFSLIAILLGAYSAWLLGRRMTRRLYVIQDTINKVGKGNRSARSTLTGIDEAAVLAREFNAMLDALEERDSKLKESELRFRKLFHNAAVPLCLINHQGVLVDFNQMFVQTFGYTHDDVPTINEWWLRAYPDPEYRQQIIDFWRPAMKMALEAKTEILSAEYRVTCKNGEVRTVIISATVINDGFLTTFVDITELKKAERDLIVARDIATESDRLKSVFLANMSHEIRTPMNSILGFSELLKEPDLTQEQQLEYLEIIESSGKRMLNTINDIVDISRIESGQVSIRASEINIVKKINDVCFMFKREAERKGIQIYINNVLKEDEVVIKSDRDKVYAILANLVKNAIKFTREGSIEIGCRTLSTASLSTGEPHTLARVELYVKDTGIGIRPDQQKYIFERFRQGSETLNKQFEGSGLGLAISKAYVEMLGGQIWVESEADKGSVFYFTLSDLSVYGN